jgi:predicted ATPase/DNA-binding CsgD family transcriptional regulator
MPATGERCEVCGADLPSSSPGRGRAGRPARYCSSACRQRAYRQRISAEAPEQAERQSVPAPATPPPTPAAAPPIRSALPVPLDSFVGRERDLAELTDLLGRYRLVTLLGPGGAGKTRLAVELATRVRPRFGYGPWLVELASLTDPALLAQAVADCVNVREEVGRPVLDTLVAALRPQQALLVLDNCEHLVAAAADLVELLLRRCPDLRVLVTSRESLELPGEAVFRVAELSLPAPSAGSRAAHLMASDAVRLFVERASASAPDFALTDDNAAHVAAICTHLDGIPLAIELAARRTRLFPVVEIRARLADRFRLLTAGPRTAADRHRDLRATIEWSYDLLEPTEQTVFRRLSVLVGGFGLTTATAVCADDTDDGVPADAMLDLLSGLEARSLIVPNGEHDGGRFRQLESIRLYGREQLTEEDVVFDRLTRYLVDLAEPIVGDGMLHCYEELQPLDVERANLLAATEWAARRGDPRHLLLAAALGRCWRHRGYVSDGWALLRPALDTAGPDHPGRPAALIQAAHLVAAGGDYAAALAMAAEAVLLEERAGHPVRLAKALDTVATVHVAGGQQRRAYEAAQRVLALTPRLEHPLDLAVCLHNQAYHLLQAGHAEQAGELMDRCLPLYRDNSPYPLPAEWLHSAGMLAVDRGDLGAADRYFREALERYLTVNEADGLPTIAVDALDGLAVVAALGGQPVRALRLDAAADAVRQDRRLGREVGAERQRHEVLAAARAALPPDRADDAVRDGARLAAPAAVRYAVHDLWAAEWPLTAREVEIARLVADGLTNRQIATRLRLTERAVETSLKTVRTKVGVNSRAGLAAWAAEYVGSA